MSFKQSDAHSRNKESQTSVAHGDDGTTASRPITMNDAVKDSSGRRLEFRGTRWLAHDTCSGCPVSRSSRASRRANWSTRMRHWRSLSDSCWCRGAEKTWTQEQLDCSFPLVRDYGDKQSAINSLGSLWEHMSLCANAFQGVTKIRKRDH